MITICCTYFKSLGPANLDAALYSVRQQDLSHVAEIVLLDNDTPDAPANIQQIVERHAFPVPVRVLSTKHGNPALTQSWSTNTVVRETSTPWILFTRADFLLDFNLLQEFEAVRRSKPEEWLGFITATMYHFTAGIELCERMAWRTRGLDVCRDFAGAVADYTCIDAGVWMMPRIAFELVGGMDETLTAWGHAQTHFQHKLFKAGVEFVRLPNVWFYHPQHSAKRDIEEAHKQLATLGVDLKEMWARYHGPSPY